MQNHDTSSDSGISIAPTDSGERLGPTVAAWELLVPTWQARLGAHRLRRKEKPLTDEDWSELTHAYWRQALKAARPDETWNVLETVWRQFQELDRVQSVARAHYPLLNLDARMVASYTIARVRGAMEMAAQLEEELQRQD